MTTVAIIAGETSGDQLGGWLMEALKKKRPDVRFIGIGGDNMQLQGLQSLFPMHELSLIGVFEILPHVFKIKKRIAQTIEFLTKEKPDILITIDSPGFNKRIAKALRASGLKTKLVHYVAPTVWSHRPERTETFAQTFDMLLALLPFEPQWFWNDGLDTHFVGHEIAWFWKNKGNGARFRTKHNINERIPLLAVFPGSRSSELKRHMPIFREVVGRLKAHMSTLEVVMQLPPHMLKDARKMVKRWPVRVHLLSSNEDKKDLFAASTAALTKSGTVALECALAGLPNVTAYRAHPISAWVVDRLLTIPHVNMANILLGYEAVPEFLQKDCKASLITPELLPLLKDENAREAQRTKLLQVSHMLGADEAISPSDKAADILAKLI